jgi:hypothetical protein
MVPYLPLSAACGEPQVVTPEHLDRMTNRDENLPERSLMRDDMAAACCWTLLGHVLATPRTNHPCAGSQHATARR